jgi:DNA-binding transcriptional regulator YiaG
MKMNAEDLLRVSACRSIGETVRPCRLDGEQVHVAEVRAICRTPRRSQREFAHAFHFPPATLKSWEQAGRPPAAARASA